MNKKEIPTESKKVFNENQVLAVLEKMDGKIDLMAEGQVALRDEVREFKIETKDNFSAVFEYLSKIDDELADIREELEKKKE